MLYFILVFDSILRGIEPNFIALIAYVLLSRLIDLCSGLLRVGAPALVATIRRARVGADHRRAGQDRRRRLEAAH